MRILFVAQRYGHEVAGGAESHCRHFATRMAMRGHDIHVLTSRAVSYVDWANSYPAGTDTLDGVAVHRLSTHHRRQARYFAPLDGRVVSGDHAPALLLQEAWMRAQGPDLRSLGPWLWAQLPSFDLAIFFTYLYLTTWEGLPLATTMTPTLLHATAHDEPPLWLSIFDATLRAPTAYAFSTPEERDLLAYRIGRIPPGAVIGIGADLDVFGDGERFRRRSGLGDRPYLLYLGRVDSVKGTLELLEQFAAYRDRHRDSALALVIIGDEIATLQGGDDVILTGFVDEQTKLDALAGCVALAQPSYFESFSMALSESWVQRRPALVQGHCDVLDGQVRRSGGGIAYRNFAEWETAVDLLLERPELARRLGGAGRRYVEANYSWDSVLDRYEGLLKLAAAKGRPGGSQVSSAHA